MRLWRLFETFELKPLIRVQVREYRYTFQAQYLLIRYSIVGVAAALSAIIIVAFCLFMCRVFCPNGPEFTALDLDEIRLERLQSIEDRIKQNIRDLKAKLNFHKKKRQTVERERDLKLRLQSYVAGEAADDSDDDAERGRLLPREEKKGPDRTNILEQENLFNSPIRNFPSPEKKGRRAQLPVTSPSPPPHKLIRDYEEEKEDKEDEKEEKEDLWKMWDKVATQKTATKTLTQHTDTAVEKQKSYHSIRYENKANRKEFLASMMSDPREEKADDYNTAMMYTESQWQSRPSAKKDQVQHSYSLSLCSISYIVLSQDYSINVSVKDYRSAEKYTGTLSIHLITLTDTD